MIDLLKKSLYAGIGATVVTAEKVEASLQDLVDKGKISAEEAKSAAGKVAEDSKKEFEDAKDSLNALFNELLEKAPVARKSEVKALTARIEILEAEVQSLKAAKPDL